MIDLNRRQMIKECNEAYKFINHLMVEKEDKKKPYMKSLSIIKKRGLSIHRFINEVRDIISARDKVIITTILKIWEDEFAKKEMIK